MEADALFLMGTGKAVCKDYAAHCRRPGWGAAVISDGCSQSSKSDIGARLLAESFLAVLLDYDGAANMDSRDIVAATKERLRSVAGPLRLPAGALDATLVAAVAGKNLRVFIWGDGHVLLINKDSSRSLISSSYANSAPYYLSYELLPENMAGYRKTFGEPLPLITIKTDNGVTPLSDVAPFYCQEIPIENVDCVCVLSDGLNTFTTPASAEPIDPWLVLRDLADFKSYPGAFVQRRMVRFQKSALHAGMTHYDDISCAALAFTEDGHECS